MKLILNMNNLNYKDFLTSNVDVIAIGLKGFCCGYLISYSLLEIKEIINDIHNHNKEIYLSANLIGNEEKINEFIDIVRELKELNFDGIYVSDFGFLQVLKENGLLNKVIFNPITSITNKYSLKIFNSFSLHHSCIANELNLKEVIETSNYNNGNLELLVQGYYQICNSKRKLITNFLKKFKIKSTSKKYYIKEENRDYAYPIIEIENDLLIYIDRQRCLAPYFDRINETNPKFLRIDNIFLDKEETELIINTYHQLINNLITTKEAISILKDTNSNFKCLENISILKKEKENE